MAINPGNPQQVAVAYQDNAHVACSFDAGSTWTIAENTASKSYRVSGDVSITYDKQGRAFLCYIAFDRLGTTNYWAHGVDVFCSTSADRGKKWTPAVRVNSDPIHNGADDFFQWLAVDQDTGAANVIFYDRRQDEHNRKAIMALARSTDGGQSFQNYAWTTTAFDTGGVFMGDYTGLAALGGRAYGAWTEKPDPKARGTVIRAEVADFNNPAH